MATFSERLGVTRTDGEIVSRYDAPDELRAVVVNICGQAGVPAMVLRKIVCQVLFKEPDENNWSDENVIAEVRRLLREAEWFEVYDVIEAIASPLHAVASLARRPGPFEEMGSEFEKEMNRYFHRAGIGWKLKNALLEFRGSEATETALLTARDALRAGGHTTAASELHEAIGDLSRRPSPEITGAIQHAMAGLECLAREKAGTKETLGELIRRHRGIFPPPLDVIADKAWGWSSNFGRHLQHGAPPALKEAELMVGLSAVLCRYLVSTLPDEATSAQGWPGV